MQASQLLPPPCPREAGFGVVSACNVVVEKPAYLETGNARVLFPCLSFQQ